jgi:hypothetical protein
MLKKKYRLEAHAAFIATLPESIRPTVRIEERELSSYGMAFPDPVCVFTDVLPGETKGDYFARKGLGTDREYLSFIIGFIVIEVSFVQDTVIRCLIPEELGGHRDWPIRGARPGPLPGTWIIPQGHGGGYAESVFVPTELSKAEYYKANPLSVDGLRTILELIMGDRERIRVCGDTYIDHLIPCGTEWNLPDRSAENSGKKKQLEGVRAKVRRGKKLSQ